MSDPKLRVTVAEVLVIGGGPAGLAAAAAASAAGRRVVLVDSNSRLGGQIWRADRGDTPLAARRWLRAVDRVEVLLGARVVDIQELRVSVLQGDRVLVIEAAKIVLATGSRERFLPFPGWTSPRVLGVGGIQAFAKQGFDVEGKRILIAGSGPLLLAVAQSLHRRGAVIVGIVEQAPARRVFGFGLSLFMQPRKLMAALRLKLALFRVPCLYSAWPVAVTDDHSTDDQSAVDHSARVAGSKPEAALQVEVRRAGAASVTLGADFLALGFGLVPDVRIAAYLACELRAGAVWTDDLQLTSQPSVYAAGESTGIGGVERALAEGRVAGFAAAGALALAQNCRAARRREQIFADRLARAFVLREELRSMPEEDTVVCRCEDVPWRDLRDVPTMRSAKLQTRCGMGACQGRVCGPALEYLTGVCAERVRPPFEPVRMDVLTQMTEETAGNNDD